MSDMGFKTTFTQDEVQNAKEQYLESKTILANYLKDLTQLVDQVGEKPMSGEQREEFMRKFSTIDHSLLGKFDQASFNYFEALENSVE